MVRIKLGFTLAETLITLMILGVIAALTIPSLMQATHKREMVTGLKKANSTLAQAVMKMQLDMGFVGESPDWENPSIFWPRFTKELNAMKVCNNNEPGCFTEGNLTFLHGGSSSDYDAQHLNAKLADGMGLNYLKETGGTSRGISPEDTANNIGRIIVDINGQKPPNKYGDDLFIFCIIRSKGIVPTGSFDSSDCSKSGQGLTCAGKVLREGKISYL